MHEFRQVTIVGLGLIGGSVAAGLRRAGAAEHIVAWDENQTSLNIGSDLGLIDRIASSLQDAVSGADLILIAVPVQSISEMFEFISDEQIVTDVGSVKRSIIDAIEKTRGQLPKNYVPGHPIAGSEQHGVIAANPELFVHHKVLLTPTEQTADEAVQQVRKLWSLLGAEVVIMDPDHHDAVLAQTSHLPHLLAYALVDLLAAGDDTLQVFEYAAGGFRDFSRIAASDPVMWRDIFAGNKDQVLTALDSYVNELGEIRKLIESGDGEALRELFERAKSARDHFSSIQGGSVQHSNVDVERSNIENKSP